MTVGTYIQRLRARIDRLPAGWIIVLAGFLVQFGLAVGMFALAYTRGERVGMFVTAVLIGVVVVAGVAAMPSFLLLWRGRYPRTASALAALVGGGTLVINEAHPTAWLFPVALFVAAVRAWATAGLDTMDLLRLDPGRFERVDPPNPAPDESSETSTEPSQDRSIEE